MPQTEGTLSTDIELGPVRSGAEPESRGLRRRQQSQKTTGIEDGEISDAHLKLRLKLHTTGAYGVEATDDARLAPNFDSGDYSQTQHRLFKHVEHELLWKPWLSGPQGRCVQFLVLLIVAICHGILVRKAADSGASVLADVGPPVLGIFLAKTTVFIAMQELRRISTQCPGASKAVNLYRRYVYIQTSIVALIIAPLLSLPLRPSASFAQVDWKALSPSCFTLDQLADHVQGQFPQAVYIPGSGPLLASPGDAFTSWSASIDPSWQILPAEVDTTINRTLDLVGFDKSHDDWLWGRARAGYALGEPFFIPETLPRHPISGEWHSIQKMLIAWLSCERVELPLAQYQLPTDSKILDVQVVDADGCGASFSLTPEERSSEAFLASTTSF